MSRWIRVITIVAFVAGLTYSVQGQEKKKTDGAGVAGRWTLLVKGTRHGDVSMGLDLQQDGAKVKGTFASPHGEHPVEGEFIDRRLELTTTAAASEDAPQVTFSATLEEDDTLAGYLSSVMGDMTWTAKRVK